VSETAQRADRGDLKSTSYEFFMLAVAILSIANLPLLAVFSWGSQSWQLVMFVEAALTLIFVVDFGYRLRTAPPSGATSTARKASSTS
jgi:voltage-gated potassium channel